MSAAFRSTTRRTSIGDSEHRNSSVHRRSRSVSRFSHRIAAVEEERGPEVSSENRRGNFVSSVRGSGVPEISLDDLAIELFSSSDFGGREVSSVNDASRRRGRSVSKREMPGGEFRRSSVERRSEVSDASSRRRRSFSVVRHRDVSDSESEQFQKIRNRANPIDRNIGNRQKTFPQMSTASNQQRGLRRCASQKDFQRSTDGYSSYSSVLTDDEGNEGRYTANGIGKTMQDTYAKNKVMSENHYPRGFTSADSDVLKAASTIRRNYKTKLEQSEKRKQELLAEIMLEEERGKEIKKIAVELLPNRMETAVKRPMRGRKRSNDRNRTSNQLVEEADRIIEDFISSFEETDISSFDGERSDTSSLFGGSIKPMTYYADVETFKSPVRYDLLPGEMDGVVLPWLKWETTNNGTPILSKDAKQKQPATPKTVLHDAQEDSTTGDQENSVNSKSSRGSWSPEIFKGFTIRDMAESSCKNNLLALIPRKSRIIDMHEYLKPPSIEGLLSEKWKHREVINSGGLLICDGSSLVKFCV